MACQDAVVQPYQFDPESDPEGNAPEEIQTLWLRQDISEWLVCLNMLLGLHVLLQLLPCSYWLTASESCVCLQHSLQTLGHCSHRLCRQSAHVSRLFTVTIKLYRYIINIKVTSTCVAERSGVNQVASFKLTSPYSQATVNTIKPRRHLPVAQVQLLGPVWLGLILLRGSVSRQSQLCTDPRY